VTLENSDSSKALGDLGALHSVQTNVALRADHVLLLVRHVAPALETALNHSETINAKFRGELAFLQVHRVVFWTSTRLDSIARRASDRGGVWHIDWQNHIHVILTTEHASALGVTLTRVLATPAVPTEIAKLLRDKHDMVAIATLAFVLVGVRGERQNFLATCRVEMFLNTCFRCRLESRRFRQRDLRLETHAQLLV
jgi:hypothetical protein